MRHTYAQSNSNSVAIATNQNPLRPYPHSALYVSFWVRAPLWAMIGVAGIVYFGTNDLAIHWISNMFLLVGLTVAFILTFQDLRIRTCSNEHCGESFSNVKTVYPFDGIEHRGFCPHCHHQMTHTWYDDFFR